jgi:hypothetical protein
MVAWMPLCRVNGGTAQLGDSHYGQVSALAVDQVLAAIAEHGEKPGSDVPGSSKT